MLEPTTLGRSKVLLICVGMCAAIDLVRTGTTEDIVILEKSTGFGGTWLVLYDCTFLSASMIDDFLAGVMQGSQDLVAMVGGSGEKHLFL